jgi:hypothetical protein
MASLLDIQPLLRIFVHQTPHAHDLRWDSARKLGLARFFR